MFFTVGGASRRGGADVGEGNGASRFGILVRKTSGGSAIIRKEQ
jgi:hypothetical protein